jgi:hypothetical protein
VSESLQRPGVTAAAASAAAVLGRSLDLDAFRLAGGTALAWHLSHRLSEDLDFFSFVPGAIDDGRRSSLTAALEPIADGGSIRSGDRTLHARVAGCSVSFFEVQGRWFDPSLPVSEGIALASVHEIAAMKLVAVMTRCAKKDFYDLVAIADRGISLPEMVDCGHRMYTGFAEALPHLRRSLGYFDEAESDPDPVSTTGATWPAIKRRVESLRRDFR